MRANRSLVVFAVGALAISAGAPAQDQAGPPQGNHWTPWHYQQWAGRQVQEVQIVSAEQLRAMIARQPGPEVLRLGPQVNVPRIPYYEPSVTEIWPGERVMVAQLNIVEDDDWNAWDGAPLIGQVSPDGKNVQALIIRWYYNRDRRRRAPPSDASSTQKPDDSTEKKDHDPNKPGPDPNKPRPDPNKPEPDPNKPDRQEQPRTPTSTDTSITPSPFTPTLVSKALTTLHVRTDALQVGTGTVDELSSDGLAWGGGIQTTLGGFLDLGLSYLEGDIESPDGATRTFDTIEFDRFGNPQIVTVTQTTEVDGKLKVFELDLRSRLIEHDTPLSETTALYGALGPLMTIQYLSADIKGGEDANGVLFGLGPFVEIGLRFASGRAFLTGWWEYDLGTNDLKAGDVATAMFGLELNY